LLDRRGRSFYHPAVKKPARAASKAPPVPEFKGLKEFARRWGLLVAVVIALAGLGLRASDLRADPPPDLSWSFAPYTDEGLNTYSARNLVLYGAWKTDDFFPFVIYPLVNYLVALVFKLFGIGFVQVKLVSLLAALLGVVAAYLLAREAAGAVAGMFAALLVATSYPLVMYGRLGLIETVQILFLLLTGYCFARGLSRPWLMALSGLLAGATVLLVKISAVFIVPVMVAVFAWEFFGRRDRAQRAALLRSLGVFAAGVGASAVAWLALVYLPHRADYLRYVLRHSLESPAGHPDGLAAYLFNTFTVGLRSQVIPRVAWTAAIGVATLPVLALGRRPALRYVLAWFVFGLLLLGYMNYRPPRYEIIIVPALAVAAACALARILEDGTLLPRLKPGLLKSALAALWLWPVAAQLAIYTNGFWGVLKPKSEGGLLFAAAVIAAVLAAAAHLLFRSLKSGLVVRPVAGRVVLAALMLLLVLQLDLGQYSRWFGNRTHNMTSYSKDLDAALPDDAVLAGGWAPALMMDSRKRALCITDWANTEDPVGRYGATHFVSPENGFDYKLFSEKYPALVAGATVLRRFNVRGMTLTVYSLPR
jgi:4-amino-4-deoxy-L-arabinose transferase-like glycosyltransferase